MTWRLAKSLEVLRAQTNTANPGRDKTADGTIGDQAHRNRNSAHNPDALGVVRAWDCTGRVGHELAEQLRDARDPRIALVISEGRLFSAYEWRGVPAWTWRRYTGRNPHHTHAHIQVQDDPSLYDDHRQWNLGGEEVVTSPEDVAYFQRILAADTPQRPGKGNPYPIHADGIIGPKTRAALEDWQARRGLTVTGTLSIATCCSLQSHANLSYADKLHA